MSGTAAGERESVWVLGAGLAGCEAAWQLACRGFRVRLMEMKPRRYIPAHTYPGFAELVCSNSLKAARLGSAAGLLKHEMARLGSLVVRCALETSVAAGGALAVDRFRFSDAVTEKIRRHPNIEVVPGEVKVLPEDGFGVVATGPLTSDALAADIARRVGKEYLSFYDAAAPIVSFDSIDRERVFFAARYGRGEDDYINCPFTREEYERFYTALTGAESAPLHEFDRFDRTPNPASPSVYEGCMPIEVMARRGADTIRYGPLKPVGLTDPRTGRRPWAVVQLRRENQEGSLYNLVGFQTNLKFGEQKRVFSMIPGLERAEFVRYGVMHRNTFLDSPRLLNNAFQLREEPRLFFAGQMTGVEGYIESAASGIQAGLNLARLLAGRELLRLPGETMLGALAGYISDSSVKDFQPMGSNMGILPPLEERVRDKSKRYLTMAQRAMKALEQCLEQAGEVPLPGLENALADWGKDEGTE